MAESIVAQVSHLSASALANRVSGDSGEESVMEGSMAIAQAVKACRPAVISAYPITPQTHIVEILARMVADGELDAEYIRVDSEFSAASVIGGASATGVRAYTASASQGLLLMTEVIYYLAGTRLPVVITAANRQLSAPIGLQPEHQDSQSLRDSGLIQLYVESAQEAYDAHVQAFKIAEDPQVLLPVMVCVDGYTLTHVYEPVTTFGQAAIEAFLPSYDPIHYLTPDRPMTFGGIADETNALEFHYLIQEAMQNAKKVIEAVAREYETTFGQFHGGLIDCYKAEDAEIILVAMGSTVSTLREAVDRLRDEGIKVGLVKVRCFRPFPSDEVRQAIKGAAAAVVLDRALSMGFQGVLASDVKAALYDAPHRPLVLGMLAGYGGREVTLETVRYIVDRARRALDAGIVEPTVDFVGLRDELLKSITRTRNGI
jgi:pyruvate ferredoxin oxidoreductase alpha subunit